MIDNCIHDGTLDKADKILVYAQSESLLSKKTRMAKAEIERAISFTETLIYELSELVEDADAELIRIQEFLDTSFATERQLCDAWDNLGLMSSIWIEELDIEANFYRIKNSDWVDLRDDNEPTDVNHLLAHKADDEHDIKKQAVRDPIKHKRLENRMRK